MITCCKTLLDLLYPSLVEFDRSGIGLYPSSVEVIEFGCWLRALSLFGKGGLWLYCLGGIIRLREEFGTPIVD